MYEVGEINHESLSSCASSSPTSGPKNDRTECNHFQLGTTMNDYIIVSPVTEIIKLVCSPSRWWIGHPILHEICPHQLTISISCPLTTYSNWSSWHTLNHAMSVSRATGSGSFYGTYLFFIKPICGSVSECHTMSCQYKLPELIVHLNSTRSCPLLYFCISVIVMYFISFCAWSERETKSDKEVIGALFTT